MEEEIPYPEGDICKPEQIGNNKIFTEWYAQVYGHCNNMEFFCYGLFQIRKPRGI